MIPLAARFGPPGPVAVGLSDPGRQQRGDKWDSGKVTSERSVNVAYAGGSLSSGESCCWTVRVWDQDDRLSAYSEPAAFSMGLLNESDWTVTNGLFGIPLDYLHREHWAWTDPATVVSSVYPRKHMPRFWS